MGGRVGGWAVEWVGMGGCVKDTDKNKLLIDMADGKRQIITTKMYTF